MCVYMCVKLNYLLFSTPLSPSSLSQSLFLSLSIYICIYLFSFILFFSMFHLLFSFIAFIRIVECLGDFTVYQFLVI